MNSFILFFIITFCFFSCGNSGSKNKIAADKLSGDNDTCDNPDAPLSCLFVNVPPDITNRMQIADDNEEGKRIVITGQIFKEDGLTPYSELIMYAYHTDNKGYYSRKGNETGVQKKHGYLFGYCNTDNEGRYEIHTIRPGRYPVNKFPAHIHVAIKEPDGNMQYLNDFVFSDDSLVTKEYLSQLIFKGDDGVIISKENGSGIQEGNRITILK